LGIKGDCAIFAAMFSGIIEAKVKALKATQESADLLRIWLERPDFFDDIRTGDSIAVNGVCLTVERFDDEQMQFAVAAETLKVTGWDENFFLQREHNLERSLRFGDRIHGHLVSGHVESMAEVSKSGMIDSDSYEVKIKLPENLKAFVWNKVSLCINGISLTVNEVKDGEIQVCLVPETQERTNLSSYKVGEKVCVEPDYMAKALFHWKDMERA